MLGIKLSLLPWVFPENMLQNYWEVHGSSRREHLRTQQQGSGLVQPKDSKIEWKLNLEIIATSHFLGRSQMTTLGRKRSNENFLRLQKKLFARSLRAGRKRSNRSSAPIVDIQQGSLAKRAGVDKKSPNSQTASVHCLKLFWRVKCQVENIFPWLLILFQLVLNRNQSNAPKWSVHFSAALFLSNGILSLQKSDSPSLDGTSVISTSWSTHRL